jgi:hypothetical protein
MTGTILLGIILGFPLLLGLMFRVSVSHLFFSLMAGELLARYFGHDLASTAPGSYGELLLILTPMLLTAYLLRGTLSKGKLMLNLAPLVLTGIIFAAFILPVLPLSAQDTVRTVSLGNWLMELNRVIIGGVVVLQLVALWLLNHRTFAGKKRGQD